MPTRITKLGVNVNADPTGGRTRLTKFGVNVSYQVVTNTRITKLGVNVMQPNTPSAPIPTLANGTAGQSFPKP